MRKGERNYTAIGVPSGEPAMKAGGSPQGSPTAKPAGECVEPVQAQPVGGRMPAQEVKQPLTPSTVWLQELHSSRPRPKDTPMHESGLD